MCEAVVKVNIAQRTLALLRLASKLLSSFLRSDTALFVPSFAVVLAYCFCVLLVVGCFFVVVLGRGGGVQRRRRRISKHDKTQQNK